MIKIHKYLACFILIVVGTIIVSKYVISAGDFGTAPGTCQVIGGGTSESCTFPGGCKTITYDTYECCSISGAICKIEIFEVQESPARSRLIINIVGIAITILLLVFLVFLEKNTWPFKKKIKNKKIQRR